MAFQQLYYTSCENGLAGYGGYQFNAVTPGTSPVIMREVEDRSVYEPPRWLLAEPCLDEPEAYPVSLSYGTSEATDAVILTHVVFAGTDYSGRPGNYFAHALVTTTPGPDLGAVLPAELWGAEFWRGTPAGSSALPELPGPPPRGVVDRPGVQAFLDARGTGAVLPELLTAVWRAMAGDRQVLLASDDANENIWWIAAVSYLLGEHLAPRMSFTTYSHRPGYSRHHVTGIQSDAVPADADSAFWLFDLDAGKGPGGAVHPLATLLADTGIMATQGLWRQAGAFASKTEEGPDDWFGPVAAAAGLLRGRLSARETSAVVRWLPGAASRIPAQHASVVLGVALAQPDAGLDDEQLLGLLDLARRLRSVAQAERLENLLVERAVGHIVRGETGVPVELGPGARASAQARVSGLLRTATPAVALAALEWAGSCRALPADAELERYGQFLAPAEPEATRLLFRYPPIRRGFLARLAQEPRELAARVLAGPVGALLEEEELRRYPMLAEERLFLLVAAGRMSPEEAYDPIVDIRIETQREPYVDAELLERLWSAGCPPQQIAELLGILDDRPDPAIRGWFARQIQAAAAQGTKSAGWLGLAQALTSRSSILPLLPPRLAELVQHTATEERKRQQVRSAVKSGDLSVFPQLYADHEAAPPKDRESSARELADLLTRADPLAEALRDCPQDVMAAFCAELAHLLAMRARSTGLAVRVVMALVDPDLQAQPELHAALGDVFEQVSQWRRTELNYLESRLPKDSVAAKQFELWRENQRGAVSRNVRKLLGGGRPAPAGQDDSAGEH